jgi:hypothetical protein
MKKRQPKTPKEKQFAQEYAKTGNATESASRAYDVKNRDVARNIGSQNLAKLSLESFFEEADLDKAQLIKQLVKATKATKISYNKSIPDWNTRLKAIDMCLKLSGMYREQELATKKEYEPQKHAPLTVDLKNEAVQRLILKTFEYLPEKQKSIVRGNLPKS